MQASKLQELGVNLMGISWGACALLSAGGVSAVSIISGFLSNAFQQLSINISNPLLFLWFLIVYGLPAALAIGSITLIIKGLLFVTGKSLVWTGSRLNQDLAVPGISIPIHRSETKKLFRTIERKLDQRNKVLKKAGVQVSKEKGKDGSRFYRYDYKGYLIYHFAMMLRPEEGPNRVGFRDGWTEPQPNVYTALGKIYATLDAPKPMVHLTNLSLLENQGIPLASGLISYEDLAERIWAKARKLMESKLR